MDADSTVAQRDNVLLCYELIPEEVSFYFIPSISDVPLPLLHALIRLEGVYVNHLTKSPDSERADKDAAYLSAALCAQREHLDDNDQHQQNRFFGALVKYKVDTPSFSFESGGTVHLIRTGFLM
jgi:hypothetical protein